MLAPCRSLLFILPLQVGPRLNFSTAWSANAVSIFRSCGLSKVVRAECSRRFRLRTASGNFALSNSQVTAFAAEVRAARPSPLTRCCVI
jgi:hypothetical protein